MGHRGDILICDDEPELTELIKELLEKEGFSVCAVTDPLEALPLAESGSFDLAVLDIMMPGMDGFELVRRIRSAASSKVREMPVVLLSAKGEEFDKVLGFTLGADDYVTKPFMPRELVVRIRARLRGSKRPSDQACFEVGAISVNVSQHECFVHGERLQLTPKEFDCLRLLVQAKGRPLSAKEIFESAWGEGYNPSSRNTVMVYIRRLRKRLSEVDASQEFIQTVWGVGYRIAVDERQDDCAGDE